MENLFSAFILGIVEGVTEFLPVSSTGHLILTNSLLGMQGEKIAAFDVIIQLGAILAVVVLYRERFVALVRPRMDMRFSGVRGLWLLCLTSIPASVVGLIAHDAIKQYLFGPRTVALALFVGAIMILVVESMRRNERFLDLDDVTPFLAFGIGCFQCLALWPGFSRSASTIMGGMLLGTNRKLAAEYSFVAAVPIMCAATGYDFLKNYHLFSSNDLLFLAVGFGVSFVSAWAAVKFFIALLKRTTLRPFAYYRLILAPLVLIFWPN
ncbi:MAG: undecaprenyl-diphosphate phosphatase [Desulfovibrio sp.]|uniref:undecaprenyl-diphosphate phosphatase n=1 Tax=Desulfovibrio sp. 7SRBS1 TaxID=3378064 RepID=UPI003B411C7B